MNNCDELQIALEQRRHGVLDAAASAEVEAHLATCPSCQAFERASAGAELELRTHAAQLSTDADWARLNAVAEQQIARSKRYLLVSAFLSVMTVALFGAVLKGEWSAYSSLPAIIVALVVLQTRRSTEATRAAAHAKGPLLEMLAQSIDRELRNLQQGLYILPIISLTPWWLFLLFKRVSTTQVIGGVLFTTFFLAFTLYVAISRLPAAKRLRAELR